jgi:hypothetical protein
MEAAVDLQDQHTAIREQPFAVGEPEPTSGIAPSRLTLRQRQTVAATHPRDIDLSNGLRTAGDVVQCAPNLTGMAQVAQPVEPGQQAVRGGELLLHDRSDHALGSSRRGLGRPEQKDRRLDLAHG